MTFQVDSPYGRWDYDYDEVDNHLYGNLDLTSFQELAVGRIFSLTSADIFSYLSRDLLYNKLDHPNNFAMLWPPSFACMRIEAEANDKLLSALGFNKQSIYLDSPGFENDWLNAKRDLEDKFYIAYLGHGFTGGWTSNTQTSSLRENNIKIGSSVIFSHACLTCGYDYDQYEKNYLWCANVLRHGAIGHIGATRPVGGSIAPTYNYLQSMLEGKDLGNSLKSYKYIDNLFREKMAYSDVVQGFDTQWEDYEPFYILNGDPTFNLYLSYPEMENMVDISFTENSLNGLLILEIPQSLHQVEYSIHDQLKEYFVLPSYSPFLIEDNNYYFTDREGNKLSSSRKFLFTLDSSNKIKSITKIEFEKANGEILEIPMGFYTSEYYYEFYYNGYDYGEPGNFLSIRTYFNDENYVFLEISSLFEPDELAPKHKFKIYLELNKETQ